MQPQAAQPMTLQPMDFGDYLVERKVLDEAQLLDVLADSWHARTQLTDAIVRRGYLDAQRLEELRAEFENVHVVYV